MAGSPAIMTIAEQAGAGFDAVPRELSSLLALSLHEC